MGRITTDDQRFSQGNIIRQLDHRLGTGGSRLGNLVFQRCRSADLNRFQLAVLSRNGQGCGVGRDNPLGRLLSQVGIILRVRLNFTVSTEVGPDTGSGGFVHRHGIVNSPVTGGYSIFYVNYPGVTVLRGQFGQKLLHIGDTVGGQKLSVSVYKGGPCLVKFIFDGPQVFGYIHDRPRIRISRLYQRALHIVAQHIIDPMPFQQRVIMGRFGQPQRLLSEQQISIAVFIAQIDPIHGLTVADLGCVDIKVNAFTDVLAHLGSGYI